MLRRWFLIAVVLALICGTVLSLPTFWGRPVVGQKASQVARHWLACVFTASSALTGTGLSPHDIGDDFNRNGQIVILVLMQAGGLAVLIAGSVVGWGIRRRMGWGGNDDDPSPPGLRRLILFVCALALACEALGAVAAYCAWRPFDGDGSKPILEAIFLSVSAFSNAGLTLSRDSLVGERTHWMPYGVVLPLMVLGSIGGPVLFDLWRGMLRRGRGGPLSREARVTLVWTAALLCGGGGLLFFVESTPRWQLRNPREDTPGRIHIREAPASTETIFFSSEHSSSAQSQRLRTMSPTGRAMAAFFLSESSRGGGLRVARLDEQSLSPASRVFMMVLMVIGGAVGGTAGGLRILVVVWLLTAVFGRPRGEDPARQQAVRAAACTATSMLLLIGATTLVLVYRDAASVEECAFEAVSACCNCGLSTGLTRRLSIEGQVMVILAMLLGRVVPLAVLARESRLNVRADQPVVTCGPQPSGSGTT